MRLVKDKDGRSKGYAYIEFYEPVFLSLNANLQMSASKALTLHGESLGGRTLKVEISNPTKKAPTLTLSPSVYVFNLNDSITEEDLKSVFSPCGEVEAVRLVRTKEGKLRGFGYVDFNSEVPLLLTRLTPRK